MKRIANIFKTIFLCLFLHFSLVFVLVFSGYSLNLIHFSIGIITILGISGLYAGYKDIKLSEIDAIISGLVCCSLILLFISQYQTLDREINIYLYIAYGGVFYITSFIGSIFYQKKGEETT